MYTQFQRFIATLLLFSILLQSCGNPNCKMVAPVDAGNKGQTSQPRTYTPLALQKQEAASERATKVGGAPEIDCSSEALGEAVSESPYAHSNDLSGRAHRGDRSRIPSSTTARSPIASSLHLAQSRPSSALKKPPTHVATKPQHVETGDASPQARHRDQQAWDTPRPMSVGPSGRTTQPSLTLQSVEHSSQAAAQPTTKDTVPQPPSCVTLPSAATQHYPSAQGHQVCFHKQEGMWIAQVQDGWGHVQKLPVVCAPDQGPEQAIQQLASMAPGQYKYWIHILATDQPPWAPRVVYVGAMGVRGGGNSSSRSCTFPYIVGAGYNSDGEPDGTVKSGNLTFYRSDGRWYTTSGYRVDSDERLTLSANDIRAISTWHYHSCNAGFHDCYVPYNSYSSIVAQRERRQEERRERRRRQEEARRREEEHRRQEEQRRAEERRTRLDEAHRREEERRTQEEQRRAEERRTRLDEAHRREEERRRQEEQRKAEERRTRLDEAHRREEERRRQEEAEAKRKADGQIWANQIGSQAAEKGATHFEKGWHESAIIQKQQRQLSKAIQAMDAPQATRQTYVQEYIGMPSFEGPTLNSTDFYNALDEETSTIDTLLPHEASLDAPSKKENQTIPISLGAAAKSTYENKDSTTDSTDAIHSAAASHTEEDITIRPKATDPQNQAQPLSSSIAAWQESFFHPFKMLKRFARTITISFDHRPLTPVAHAVDTVTTQLNQCSLCTTQLEASLTRGREILQLLEAHRHTPTLDFNGRVLRNTLEEKLSCHLRLYNCLHVWTKSLPGEEHQVFEVVMVPILRKHFFRADTTVQQKLLTYWENGGNCYTNVLQNTAVKDWLHQSLYLDITQEALASNNTLLLDKFRQELAGWVPHEPDPIQQKLLPQLLWGLRARQKVHQLDLLGVCKLMEWLPTDINQAIDLLNDTTPDLYQTLKAHWIRPKLAVFQAVLPTEEISALVDTIVRLPWDKAMTTSFLREVTKEQDSASLKDLLNFLEKYPIDASILLDLLSTVSTQDAASPCQVLHHMLACELLYEPLKALFDQHTDTLYQQLTALLQHHLGAYDALHTLLNSLQEAETGVEERKIQALQLQEVLKLLRDYETETAVREEAFKAMMQQPAHLWEKTIHQLVVDATFRDSYELSTQEIIDSIAQHAPDVFFVGDAQQLQSSYDALMTAYQGTSTVLRQATLPKDTQVAQQHQDEAQQPIAQWSTATITRWAGLVKEQHAQVTQSELLAVIKRAVVLHHGFAPRATQLLSVLTLLNTPEKTGRLAQINTGEGKSLIVAMLAAVHALKGKKVDVLTTSTELSIPEVKKQTPFFNTLGLTVGENSKKNAGDDKVKHATYQKDIVYGTAEDFQADIISTEFFRRNIRGNRGFGVVLVDEVDSMLFDDRSYSTRLSSPTPAMNHLEMIYGTIWSFVNLLTSRLRVINDQYYFIDFEVKFEDLPGGGVQFPEGKTLSDCAFPVEDPVDLLKNMATHQHKEYVRPLTSEEQQHLAAYKKSERDIDRLSAQACQNKEKYQPKLDAAIKALEESPWSKILQEKPYLEIPVHLQAFANKQMPNWIESAVGALLCYQKDKHYHVKNGKIIPIDHSNTGVLQYNTVWDNGLAQFLQIKEGLKVIPESISTNFISKPGYFKRYEDRLYGLTGTLGNATTRSFLQEMYGVDTVTIPPYKHREIIGNTNSRYLCKELQPQLVTTPAAWYNAVTESVLRPARNGQAVLVICNYISQVNQLKKQLASQYDAKKLFVYTGKEDFQKHQIDSGEIIVATNIAGRGTDLTTSAAVEEKGGLHVCITFLPPSYRVELQNAGRTARQGKKGSAQLVLHTSGAETLEDLRAQRDQIETQAIERAKQDVEHMLSSDRLFMRYCGAEASFFPTMETLAKMQLSQQLQGHWQVHAEVTLSSNVVATLYEKEVERHVQTIRQQTPEPDSWKDYTEEELLKARKTQLQQSQAIYRAKYPLAAFRKQYEIKQREAFLAQYKTHQDIPADVLVAFLQDQVYVPSGAELTDQYGWTESERHGSQERWGIWLKEDSTETDLDSTVRHQRFDSFERTLQHDAQEDRLIKNPYYYVQKGNAYLQQNFSRLAVKACNRAIALDPTHSANARFNKARGLLGTQKNKYNHSEAKEELKEAAYLVKQQKNILLSLDALLGQTGKKPLSSEHVQHQLDILSQQENYIQAVINVIEIAQERDWDVEITEVKSLQELFKEAPENRQKAIEEAMCNGFTHVFTIKEKQPKSWWSIVAVALIGLAQIGLSALCTVAGLVNVASHFMQQGIADMMAAFKAIKGGGYFSWKDWGIQKAISMAVAFIGVGVKAITKWVNEKIIPNLKQGVQNFIGATRAIGKRITGGFTTNDASKVRTVLQEAGARLASGIAKDLVQTLANEAIDELLVKNIAQSIEKKVTQRIIEALEKNTLVQTAIALDIKNDNNHWQSILQNEGLQLLATFQGELNVFKEIFKGVATNELLSRLKDTKLGDVAVVKEFVQAAPQITEATYKALTLTDKFLGQFASKVLGKHKKAIEKMQQEQQKKEEEQKQQKKEEQKQQEEEEEEVVQRVSSAPLVGEEEVSIPKVNFDKDYKSDLRNYYYEAPSNTNNLYSVFISNLTGQITNQIQGGIIQPLVGIGVSMTVDKVLAKVHQSIKAEEERYMQKEGKLQLATNQAANASKKDQVEQEDTASKQDTHKKQDDPSAKEAEEAIRNGAKFDRTTAAHLANKTGQPVYIYEEDKQGKIKLVDIIGDTLAGQPIRLKHTSSEDEASGHWEAHLTKRDIKQGKTLKQIDGSGQDNCGFAAAACQMKGISSAEELRNQLADHIATSPHTALLHDIQQRTKALHPEVLMKGGNLHEMMYLMHKDPNDFHNRLMLSSSNKEYHALEQAKKTADQQGDSQKSKEIAAQLSEMEVEAFRARREAQRQRVINLGKNIFYLVGGVGNALGNNLSLGALHRDHYSSDPAFGYGQKLGDVLSLVAGGAEFLVGDGMMGTGGVAMAVTAGAAAPVAVPLSASGAAITSHGALVMGKALVEFSKHKEGKHEGRKQSGKNDPHANPEARSKAQEKVEELNREYKRIQDTEKGTKGLKKKLQEIKDKIKHWQKKADFKGETHSRTKKGN